MRAFLEERAALKAQGTGVGETLLFFGCRKRDEDYIYREEIQQWVSQGVITGLHLAFSREQEKKVYVQHRIVEEGEALSRVILEKRAHIYVCGATSMGSDVLHAFQEVLNKHGKLSVDAAKAHVKTMQDESRYVQELWG
jgi:NADPH-ferrihemoprotein reductase